jgi:hypothetical protein
MSESYTEHSKLRRKTLIAEIIVMSVFILIITPAELSIYIVNIYWPGYQELHPLSFDILLLVRSILKLAVDGYMFFVFISTMGYLVIRKRTALKAIDESLELNSHNRFIINFTVFLWLVNVLSSLLSIVLFSLYHSSLVQEDDPNFEIWDDVYKISFRTYLWTINFLTSLALLYLFHYQGSRIK